MFDDAPLYKAIGGTGPLPERLEDEPHAYADKTMALRWGGLWPDGQPSRLIELRSDGELELRDGRVYAPAFDVVRLVNPDEAIRELSAVFVDFSDELYDEQQAWRRALRREGRDHEKVRQLLDLTLHARGLRLWGVREFPSVVALRAAVNPAAFFTWGAVHAQASFEQWQSEAAEDPVYESGLRTAWNAWYHDVYWDDEDYAADPDANADVRWDKWDAWAALTVWYAAEVGWVNLPSDVLTRGMRDAYQAGLGMAAPIEKGVLGYAMAD